MANYSALLLDDEIENIWLLKMYLEKYCISIDTFYVATDLTKGISLCLEHKPDFLFLDINLGKNETSFELLDQCLLPSQEVIIISAYEEFALKAINHNVSAYLLKPLSIPELVKAVNKSILNLENKKILELNSNNESPFSNKNNNLIAVASVNTINLLKFEEILYCTADGKYTIFSLTNGFNFVSSRNIGEYEKLLDFNSFFRIHHKYIVNINLISSINKKDGVYCVFKNGKFLPVAKRRQEAFNKYIRLKM